MQNKLHVGVDFGTSGCRICAIDDQTHIKFESTGSFPLPKSSKLRYSEQDPLIWWDVFIDLLTQLGRFCEDSSFTVVSISIDGTSGTIIACDSTGQPLHNALMYNDCRAIDQAEEILNSIGEQHLVTSPSSALAKALWLEQNIAAPIHHFLHQADWVSNRCTQLFGVSDAHNALKLGYDPVLNKYPEEFKQILQHPSKLPIVKHTGDFLGLLTDDIAQLTGLNLGIKVFSGTTDSTTACLATKKIRLGTGITVLGSTLVTKLVTNRPIFSPSQGIYSHRIGDTWLVGGASNSGGAVIAQHYSTAQIKELENELNPNQTLDLHYYPLTNTGERFPINDPNLAPQLSPRPDSEVQFLQAILEGIADIEKLAYQLLTEKSGTRLKHVISLGGGAKNLKWQAIRQKKLSVPINQASHTESSYGSALVAHKAYSKLFRNNFK